MPRNQAEKVLRELFSRIDVRIDGDRPWDIVVHNPEFYGRVLRQRELGFGESYMDRWWDSDSIDGLACRILISDLPSRLRMNWQIGLMLLEETLLNPQRRSRSTDVARQHYDLGDDLFRAMLGDCMVYSCAFWEGATTLDEAQANKLDLICRKVGLQPGMKVLDIGCGWGSFAKYAAERYDVTVVGATNSGEQVRLAREICKDLPIEIQQQDYRDIEGLYDRVISIGMFEHVGPKNYHTFMKGVWKLLKEDGLFLLHTIGCNKPNRTPDAWTDKYIFPGGALPTIAGIGKSIEGLFVMEDWQNLSVNYEKTLLAWWENFNSSWVALSESYGDRFYRMWKYYLLTFAGSFRARYNQVWQLVLSPRGVPGGYRSVRQL